MNNTSQTISHQQDYHTTSSNDFWWLNLIYGIVLLLFGIFLLISPLQTFVAALFFIGLFVLIAGAVEIIRGIVSLFSGSAGYGILVILLGLLGVGVGFLIFRYPVSSAYTFILFTAVWLIISGAIQMFEKPEGRSRGLHVFLGILYIIVGLALFSQPLVNGAVFFWILGLFALVAGPIRIALAINQKNAGRSAVTAGKPATTTT